MKLLAYVRVSREDEKIENQEYAILKLAAAKGYQVVDTIREIGVSGAVPPQERPGFKQLLSRLDEVDGIVVYALDRIARSLFELYQVIRKIEEKGKVVISVREEWLNTLDSKIRDLIIAILGWAGEMERELIRERTREALARLRAQGIKLGRPAKWNENVRKRLISLVGRGLTLKEACQLVGIGYSTAKRYLSRDPEYLKARMKARLSKF